MKRIPSCKHVEVKGQSTLQLRDASGGTFDSTFGNHLKINCPRAEIRRQSHRCCHLWIDGYELWNRNKHQDKALHETLSWTKEVKRQWRRQQLWLFILGKTIAARSSKPCEQFNLSCIFLKNLMIIPNSAPCQFIAQYSDFLVFGCTSPFFPLQTFKTVHKH